MTWASSLALLTMAVQRLRSIEDKQQAKPSPTSLGVHKNR